MEVPERATGAALSRAPLVRAFGLVHSFSVATSSICTSLSFHPVHLQTAMLTNATSYNHEDARESMGAQIYVFPMG